MQESASSRIENSNTPRTPRVVVLASLLLAARGVLILTTQVIMYYGFNQSPGFDPRIVVMPIGLIFGVVDLLFSLALWERTLAGWIYGVISSGFYSFLFIIALPSLSPYLVSNYFVVLLFPVFILVSIGELSILVSPWNRKFFKTP